MKSAKRKKTVSLLLSLVMVVLATKTVATAPQRPLPNPVLYLMGLVPLQIGGKDFIRYNYDVMNKDAYPAEMFAPAPALPPCGVNKNSSRTWVDILDSRGKRLYGFCALSNPNDLTGIWFALPADEVPPSWVYIELNDRQTNIKYKSNLAETTP
jgi:hypothetical protein